MSVDRLSNMLSSIKNAAMTENEFIEITYTKQCEEVAKVFKKHGYLSDVKIFKPKEKSYKALRLELDPEIAQKIVDIKRISKPGRRIHSSTNEIRKFYSRSGLVIVSTSRGVMSALDARRKKLGGEIICKVI
ncbi:30S ribosomal protein S8 [candidate division WWE3 bacterium RBG_19FT_COMBO_34_6]|uniref:Small ribosomal subunit protein uS8 n=1 Tax=candidate division WWE3 bacterium RBG_19FT_COMBO_34_6 TaxID=1802612 RepID=A0A1F4UJN6_UNCKA|nr:MAG: 30S ribosomal protein S8 [candidate division WWE3 bacterium RBG_19FT_COMBO_34_6]